MKRTRSLGGLALLVAAATMLAGCLKLDMDLSVTGDTASGTMIAALDREMAELMEVEPEDVFGSDNGFGELAGVTEEPYEEGPWTGVQYTLDQVPLAELNALSEGESEGMRIERDQATGTYRFDMEIDLTGMSEEDLAPPTGDPDAPDLTGLFDRLEITIQMSFPGEVTETNGEVTGTTVAWQPPAGELTEMFAVAVDPDADQEAAQPPPPGEEGSGPGTGSDADGSGANEGSDLVPVALVVGLALLALLAAGVGAALLVRRRSAAPATATATATPGDTAATPGDTAGTPGDTAAMPGDAPTVPGDASAASTTTTASTTQFEPAQPDEQTEPIQPEGTEPAGPDKEES